MMRYSARECAFSQSFSTPAGIAGAIGRDGRGSAEPGNPSDSWCGSVQQVKPLEANPLATKLQCFIALSSEETIALALLTLHRKAIRAEQVIVHEGEVPTHVYLILHGFAYRFKMLCDGRRQILGFLLPGDLIEVDVYNGGGPDHSVAALNDSMVAMIPRAALADLRIKHPNINAACLLVSLSERSILREWLINVGQRNAVQRIGHLFCEIYSRLQAIGRCDGDGSIDFPLTQTALADTIGLTTVHVNRSLKQLRKGGLITFRRRRHTIVDLTRLAEVAGFNDDYLRLKR